MLLHNVSIPCSYDHAINKTNFSWSGSGCINEVSLSFVNLLMFGTMICSKIIAWGRTLMISLKLQCYKCVVPENNHTHYTEGFLVWPPTPHPFKSLQKFQFLLNTSLYKLWPLRCPSLLELPITPLRVGMVSFWNHIPWYQ